MYVNCLFIQIDLNDRDALGNTCLHLAAQAGSLRCCQFLFHRYFPAKSQQGINVKPTRLDQREIHDQDRNDKISNEVDGDKMQLLIHDTAEHDVSQHLISEFCSTLNTFQMTPLHSACKVSHFFIQLRRFVQTFFHIFFEHNC